jgi:hypothetical protein
MKQIPRLETERLILRPFDNSDAAEVMRLAGEYAIADTTGNIPHPYEKGMAEEWISSHPDWRSCAFTQATSPGIQHQSVLCRRLECNMRVASASM